MWLLFVNRTKTGKQIEQNRSFQNGAIIYFQLLSDDSRPNNNNNSSIAVTRAACAHKTHNAVVVVAG